MLFQPKKLMLTGYVVFSSVFLSSCTVPFINRQIEFPSWIPILGNLSSSPVTLEYWGLWEPREVLQPVFEQYKTIRENVSVAYQERDPLQHFETVRSRIATQSPPDVIRVHASWIPFLMENLAPAPTDIVETQGFVNSFYPIASKDLVIEGRVYGMPLEIDGLALVYNKTLFGQAGITTPPRTWDTFRTQVRKLTVINSEGQLVQSGAGMGLSNNIDHFSDILGLMFAQNGVQFTDSEGNVTFHNSLSPDGRNLGAEALTFYSLFGTTEKSYDSTWETSTKAFSQGKVAMILVPSFRVADILATNPSFSIGVAPAPQLPSANTNESTSVNWGSYWVEVVPKNGQNPREAWRLLNYLSSQEGQVDFYRRASSLRGVGEPYARQDLANTLSLEPLVFPFVQQGLTYTTWFFNDATHDKVLNDAIITALAQAVRSVNAGGNAEDALEQAALVVQEILRNLAT